MSGAHFQAPLVVDNKEGWGPTDDTFQYKDMPYQPYSKSDQLGKVKDTIFLSKILRFDFICFVQVADWTGTVYGMDKRMNSKK